MSESLATISALSPKIVHAIGWNVARGMTVEQACLIHEPPIPVEMFNQSVEHDAKLSFVFKRAQAMYVQEALEIIETRDAKEIQGQKWILEKAHAQFGRKTEMQTQVNIINGMTPEVMEKIRAAARKPVDDVIDVK